MSRARLSEELNRLLPGEQWKRVREGILAAANYSGQRTDQLRKNIDEANRLKTGVLVNGTVDFTSTTNADLSGFAWAIDYQIFQQTAAESIPVDAPDANFPRPDIFVGLDDGSIEYRAGTVDEEGNAQDPSYDPLTEVLLRAVTRNPDNSNDEIDPGEGGSDFVSKSAPGNQTIQSSITLSSLSDPNNPSNLIQIDTNGKIVIVRADRIGSFATRNLAVGFSRLARINTVVSGGPAIRDFQFKLDILATLDDDVTQQGELYCALINDGTGAYVSSILQVTGSLNPAVFTLVKVSATEYDLFYEHLDSTAILIYRPFALGPADRYIFYRRETIIGSLPAGDQYAFTLSSGGTTLDPDIVDALEGANAPDAANPFATIDDIPIVPEDFIDLLDTPNGYAGQGGKKVKVKADETGLEFVEDTGGGGRDDDAVHYDAADGKTASEKKQARDNIGLESGLPQEITTGLNQNTISRTSNFINFTTSGSIIQVLGVSAGLDGEKVRLWNRRAVNVILTSESSSITNDRFAFDTYTLTAGEFIDIIYDSSINRWKRVIPDVYLRKDIADTKTGNLTLDGNLTHNGNAVFYPNTQPVRIFETVGIHCLGLFNTGGPALDIEGRGSFSGGSGDGIITIQELNGIANRTAIRIKNSAGSTVIYLNNSGLIRHERSSSGIESIRRDEQRLYYLVSITTAGAINDQALTDGIFNYRFTAASSITGFANGEIGRTIDIDNDSGGDITLAHESGSSIAANRINLIGSADLTIPSKGKVTLKYCTGSRWELVSKNF